MPSGPLHLSVDDVAACLRDLGEGEHVTPWTQPAFAYLRALHERAGVVVSLYAFLEDGTWTLEDVPPRHRAAFTAASGWLRFGFHGLDAATHYGAGGAPLVDARAHYARFVAATRRFAGSAAIDRLPRVHRFLGRHEAVRAWRDAEAGVLGLLTADDDRPEVYHLDAALRARVRAQGAAFDEQERLHLVASLPRLEREVGVAGRLDATRAATPRCLFTHEPDLAGAAVRARVEEAVEWAARRGVGWAFPQDALASPSPATDASAADAS
ncbi:MAG: hypothetical protein P1P87_08690 [Trueperaceae bacterium]|nr:hypothetical protein [Trueperaceae bacterium]